MKKKITFTSVFPLFDSYIKDENMRSSLMNNELIIEIYNRRSNMFKYFILELSTYFDDEFIQNAIFKLITSYNEDLIVSFITSYLNSNESIKKSNDFFMMFDKLNTKEETEFNYIVNYGLENLSISNISVETLDELFDNYKDDLEFKNIKIKYVWEYLDLQEKKLLINILENDCFLIFKNILSSIEFGLKNILGGLSKYNIDYSLFTESAKESLGIKVITVIVMSSICLDNNILFDINELLKNKEYARIEDIIRNDVLPNLIKAGIEKKKEIRYA